MVRFVTELWNRIRHFFRRELWTAEPAPESLLGRGLALLRFGVMVGEGFVRDNLLLRASALTYFAVLSVIPIIAVAVAIAQSFVSDDVIAQLVGNVVAQLAAGSPEAQAKILELVSRVNFGALGTLGAVTLLLTTVLALGNIERSFNAIWGVDRDRSWSRRLPDYLAILVFVPVLAGAALSLSGTLESQYLVQRLVSLPVFSFLYDIGLKQLPTLVLSLAFAFLYWFLPNTQVKVSSALVGGIVAGVLVIVAQNLYLGLQFGVARSSALFGGLAVLPLLFVWMYFFWAIILLGAEVAYALQHLENYRMNVHGGDLDPAQAEAVGLRIGVEIARSFRDGSPAWTADRLAESLAVPVRSIRRLVGRLEKAGIVAPRGEGEKETAYQLGRPAEMIRVSDLLEALRGHHKPQLGDATAGEVVERVVAELAENAGKGPAARTLAEVLLEVPPPGEGPWLPPDATASSPS